MTHGLIRSALMVAIVGAVAFELMKSSPSRAQQPPTAFNHPEFVVATVKTSPPPEGDLIFINGLGTFRNGKLIFANASLSDLLKFAYNITSDSQLSGPDWIKSKTFASTSSRWRRPIHLASSLP